MIISDINSNSCQVSGTNGLVKAELNDSEMVYSAENTNGCGSSPYSNDNNEAGTNMATEGSSNSNSPSDTYSDSICKQEPENGADTGNFSSYGNSDMDYEGNNDDSNEPPELQNATLEASEDADKSNDGSAFLALTERHGTSALEVALMNCRGDSDGPSCLVPNPTTPHLITCSEMSALDVDKLNSSRSIVLPHNKGNSNMKREWRNVGWFTSEEEMDRVRKSQRVSKWKTVDQINGLKVFFRCNKWKRTNCNYRMYVMYYAMDRISLNESGEHDHSTLNADFKPRPYIKSPCARAVIEATPSSSQQHALDQFILKSSQAFLNNAYDHDNVFDTSESGRNQSSRPPSRIIGSSGEIVDGQAYGSYNLSDGQNIGELLQVASDMDLTFSFNSRKNCEYCFESNVPAMKGKVVVFVDFGDRVSVTERHHGCDHSTEEWRKADWKQFLWAVRGKCMNALKNI